MKTVKRMMRLLALTLALSLAAPSVLSVPGQTIQVQAATQEETVEISQTTATLIKGQKLKLTITGSEDIVKWTSSKTDVATVNSKGKVTAKAKGTTTITATVNGTKYKCKVKVVTPSISETELTLTVGDTQKLKISGTTEEVTWTSSKKSVATVSKSGKIKAKIAGTTTITATVLGKKYKCKVTVTAASTGSSTTSGSSGSSSSSSSTGSSSATSGSTSSSVATTATVYITKTGSKYHRAGCKYLSKSQIAISRTSAVARGYTACSVCKP